MKGAMQEISEFLVPGQGAAMERVEVPYKLSSGIPSIAVGLSPIKERRHVRSSLPLAWSCVQARCPIVGLPALSG